MNGWDGRGGAAGLCLTELRVSVRGLPVWGREPGTGSGTVEEAVCVALPTSCFLVGRRAEMYLLREVEKSFRFRTCKSWSGDTMARRYNPPAARPLLYYSSCI